MTLCISCDRPNAQPSATLPKMCSRCWSYLPQVTRTLYASGGLRVDRLVQMSKERNVSVRTLGGGRR